MSGKRLFLYSLMVKSMVIIFVLSLIWGHRLISQRWFDPIATTADKISAVNSAGAQLEARHRGRTGIMDAVARSDVELVKAFIARGARIDLRSLPFGSDRNEYTPLHLAMVFWPTSKERQSEIIKILLQAGRAKNIDLVNAKDAQGNTAIHLLLFINFDETRITNIRGKSGLELAAAEGGGTYTTSPGGAADNVTYDSRGYRSLNRIEMLRLLLSYGGNINAQNSLGDTLLHNVVRNNDRQFARVLLTDSQFKKLINVNLKNKAGLNPKDLAKKTHLGDMMKLICLRSECPCTYEERDGQLD